MKQKFALTAAWLLAATLNLHAQGGSLTPPAGAPGPVMKSLDQIEARTPLVAGAPGVTVDGTTGAITITAPGSYYLTGNLTTNGTASCINVGTHTCTIDLNGFIVSRTTGTETGTAGILIAGAAGQKVMIRNGHIRGGGTGAGFAAAIDTTDGVNGSVHVEDVHVANVRNGIVLNYDEGRNTVRDSSVENSGGEGIRAEVVTGCAVRDTVSFGILGNSVSDCSVVQNLATSVGIGISDHPVSEARYGSVINCSVIVNQVSATTTGIRATLVTQCVVSLISGGSTPINARIAVACHTFGGSNIIINKYNMP